MRKALQLGSSIDLRLPQQQDLDTKVQACDLPGPQLMRKLRAQWHGLDHCNAAFADIWSCVSGTADWCPFDVWWLCLTYSTSASSAARACHKQFGASFQANPMSEATARAALSGQYQAVQACSSDSTCLL